MVADRVSRRHAVYCAALICLGILVHYGWAWFPAEHQAHAFNALGAFARACLLLAVVWKLRSALAAFVAAWWVCEELMVAGCSVAYIVSPWEIEPGQAQCSALLQFDLGRIGVFAVAFLVAATVKVARCADSERG
jgi:hypothetical protein